MQRVEYRAAEEGGLIDKIRTEGAKRQCYEKKMLVSIVSFWYILKITAICLKSFLGKSWLKIV